MSAWWSWLLMAVGVTGLVLAGRVRPAVGWAVGAAAQVLWVAYVLATGQYGFIVSALVYGSVYTRNFVIARRRAASPVTAEANNAEETK